jgi:hypothetical protein
MRAREREPMVSERADATKRYVLEFLARFSGTFPPRLDRQLKGSSAYFRPVADTRSAVSWDGADVDIASAVGSDCAARVWASRRHGDPFSVIS